MAKKKTLEQRVKTLEELVNGDGYYEFAKCWQANFYTLGAYIAMEEHFLSESKRQKKKISEMVEQISSLTDETIELRRQVEASEYANKIMADKIRSIRQTVGA